MLRQRDGTEAGQAAPLLGLSCVCRHVSHPEPSSLDREGLVGNVPPR